MFRYFSQDSSPRPESYREDVILAEKVDDPQQLWRELRSAAESGWDFSSRWFRNTQGDLKDTNVTNVIPVDLNAFLAQTAAIISRLFSLRGSPEEADKWRQYENDIINGMETLMWDPDDGIWFDVSIDTGKRRKVFSASNFVPLWTKSFPKDLQEIKSKACLNYFQRTVQDQTQGSGIPTTLCKSGQQWDLPNVWPPLEHMVIMGLYNSGLEEAKEEARSLAKSRVRICCDIFKKTSHMFEKVNKNE